MEAPATNMADPIDGKEIALGVTGSIACYKAVDLASKLVQAGAAVDVIMTQSAAEFVTPLTFTAITHRPVVRDMFEPQSELGMDHVAIAHRVDLVIVAPATAHTLAKIAWGLSNDALMTTLLATQAPVIIAPAMDANMFDHPATRRNVEFLRSWGYRVAGPTEGRLASGLTGRGRMLETWELLGHAREVLGRNGDLAGFKIVVSAGGTREPVDPVRLVTNRSSGKMGHAVAEAARDRGANAVLVSAAESIHDPVGVRVERVDTAEQMVRALTSVVEVGTRYTGKVVSIRDFGCFVEILPGLEGLVHVSGMAGDHYRFVESDHALCGETTGRVYRLGDRVDVQVMSVDPARRRIDLGLVEILDALRAPERNRGPRRGPAGRVRRSSKPRGPRSSRRTRGRD